MGGWAKDVSSEGTLVWVRRPNGAWWPGRVISPLEVPDGCPAPPRAPATPIMLLGRRHGPTFIDWCNLERTKRVKPFRCGELDFDERITKAEVQDTLRRASKKKKRDYSAYTTGRYARKEDAILQALQIERAHFQDTASKTRSEVLLNVATTKSSSHAATRDAPPSPHRKRKTPNDSEDDVPQGFPRMRDLRDIGSNTIPNRIPNVATFSGFTDGLPSTCLVKRSRQSHATAKRKRPCPDQDQVCGSLRKKDRSRPLSELCNGDLWNGFKPNGQKADQHSMDIGSCSSSSSGTSSLDTIMDKCSSRRDGPFKTDESKGTEISCMTRFLESHGNDFAATSLTAGSMLELDHLQVHQPSALTKDPVCKRNIQATDCSKDSMPSRCDRRNSKKQIINSADCGGNNGVRNALDPEYDKNRAVKHRASSNETILLEKKMGKNSLNKPGPDGGKQLSIFPTGLDCDGAAKQQCSESRHKHEESSEILRSRSNCENVSASSLAFELPFQVLPPGQKILEPAKCHGVRPTKTLHLNPILHDVELSADGCTNQGRRVPLVSLMSRWNRRPVVGYPVSVEVLDGVCCFPASSINDHHATTSIVNGIWKRDEAADPECPRSRPGGAKPKSHRKTSEYEMDNLWQPHTKKPASSRKMRRLSSFVTNQRGAGEDKSAVGKFSGPTIACIPLRVVFSRINEALGFQIK
ncbi:hypothetical protein GUJ93_ZPchr0005g15250 [Zizania palustris]|uniref:PWWP domain-containing protein n=2 Tax=Zizania palustris TaxID=103762 RepID=A0A8J5S5F1_ZIZPA|nr:hypothetical protein GUJ93_ZPchr0005g15250 [Zizania palustris]